MVKLDVESADSQGITTAAVMLPSIVTYDAEINV
jgi:hypothetical protein